MYYDVMVLYRYFDIIGAFATIENMSLRISHVIHQNDPNECAISYQARSDDELKTFMYNAKYLKLECTFNLLSNKSESYAEKLKKIISAEHNVQRFKNIAIDLKEMCYICSFSEDYDIPALWAHYAIGNKSDANRACGGVVIGFQFDCTYQEYIAQIKYETSPPISSVSRAMENSRDCVTKMLTTKHESWSYEKEWRIIALCGNDMLGEDEKERRDLLFPIEKNNKKYRYIPIAMENISEIYLGSFITPENKKRILKILKDRKWKNIKCYQMENDSYQSYTPIRKKLKI